MKQKYLVDSCGVTLIHTNDKLQAYDVYAKSNGPKVALIEFNDQGTGRVIYSKVYRTTAPAQQRVRKLESHRAEQSDTKLN